MSLFAHSWSGGDLSPWSQGLVANAAAGTRTHAIRFERGGRYRIELRRWAREDGGAIDGPAGSGGGKVVPAKKARVSLTGVGSMTQPIQPGEAMAVFDMDIPAGPATRLETAFLDADDKVLAGAYYVYIRPLAGATNPP